jgi:polyhydroxyalkanoate synthesis regulator phasin
LLDELRRVAVITSGVAELTRHRAEQVVKDLVKSGDVRKDQTTALVRELLKKSAENRRELSGFVRNEIKGQIESLGLASKRDLERLERRITRLEDRLKELQGSPTPKETRPVKKTTVKKTVSKKVPAKTKSRDAERSGR